jgi:hypothetical protein
MVDWASYMSKADLMNISTITYSSLPGSKEIECIESFRQNENDFYVFSNQFIHPNYNFSINAYSQFQL